MPCRKHLQTPERCREFEVAEQVASGTVAGLSVFMSEPFPGRRHYVRHAGVLGEVFRRSVAPAPPNTPMRSLAARGKDRNALPML
jgi:hypothetical protein